MFRTVFTLGAFALLGIFALNVVFGILGGLIGFVLGTVVKVALLGLLLYGIVSILSPDTARRWREKWS
jgi:hypothetical protein